MAEAALKKEEPARAVPVLTVDRLRQIEQVRAVYEVVVPAGTEPDDLLAVAYWTHLAATFERAKKIGCSVDLIALSEDLKWEAEMRVIDAGANWARVMFKTTEDGKRLITKLGGLQTQKVVFLPGHTVEFGGVFDKWRIVRDADHKVLYKNFNTEGEAYSALAEYAKTVTKT